MNFVRNVLKVINLQGFMKEINFAKIEKKWQGRWDTNKIFEVKDSGKNKFYVLEMFPYPSGDGLHMGHAWNYTIGDIYARFKKMNGFNVLHPMGYDALGLPAENAAIKKGIHPENYTNNSVKNYIKQQKALGLSYDWSRVVNTASPKYYKWDQWIFLKMFEKKLAYQKNSSVNWCSKCDTVLANEQVHDGKCWRHDEEDVEVRKLNQWFFKTTKYADELLEGLENLNWPEKTKTMQKNWIGKSQGVEINFKIDGENWPIFTTRPDTIFGVTFMVVSAQHPKLDNLITEEHANEVNNFLKNNGNVSEKNFGNLEKKGVFTGNYAINPVNNEKIPVYVGNFVVADYGSGMVMAVPAHDQRDFDFAKKYNIKIKKVISAEGENCAYNGPGKLINSGKFNGLENSEAGDKIIKWLIKNKVGKKLTQFKLRDWGISRQRYWGTPIPIIHCKNCGAIPVPEKDLPVTLPKNVKFGKGNPLETSEEWIKTNCPKCGNEGKRETDTMDTFVNSSWYFLRYCDSTNDKKIFDDKKVNYWCPIDTYIGGSEHACMHLIYFRFYTKFLRDLGLIDFDEPAIKLFHQGMLLGENGLKMSKSKGNGVLPETVSDKYGIDTARLFLTSLASPDKDITWNEKGIAGSLRFINKIFSYFENYKIGKDSEKFESKLNQTIEAVGSDIESFKYNLAVIKLRKLSDILFNEDSISKKSLEKFLKLVSPFCPHIAEELWEKINGEGFISLSKWPKVDSKKIDKNFETSEKSVEKLIEDILQVKGIVGKSEKVFVYVIPNEKEIYFSEIEKIKNRVDVDVKIFAVNDSGKYDPENKSKKTKPGKPAIYLE